MPAPVPQYLGTLNGPTGVTNSTTTAFVALLPPWPGAGPGKLVQKVIVPQGGGLPTINGGQGVLHITKLSYSCGSTAHKIAIMRPKNWTYFTADFAKALTAIPNATLKDDPGVYSTNYKYNGGVAPTCADDAIATGDYVAYQCADGTWIVDIIASGTFGSSLALTSGTPNYTNGKVLAGSPFYFFGIVGGPDPAVGANQAYGATGWTWNSDYQVTVSATSTLDQTILDNNGSGLMSAFNPGDPLLFYSPNGTNAGTLGYISGYYLNQ